MKKIMLVALTSMTLAACADNGMSLGNVLGGNGSATGASGVNTVQGIASAVIDNQCRSELHSRQAWRLAMLALSSEQQTQWEDKICGCASQEATQSLTVTEMAQIANPSTRTQALGTVTTRAVTACVNRLYQK